MPSYTIRPLTADEVDAVVEETQDRFYNGEEEDYYTVLTRNGATFHQVSHYRYDYTTDSHTFVLTAASMLLDIPAESLEAIYLEAAHN